MRGSSRTSLGQAIDRLEPVLEAVDGLPLGDEFFAIAELIDRSAALRRALTDPSRGADAKAGGVAKLLHGKVSNVANEAVQGLARSRWSGPADLSEAVEQLGVTAVLSAAGRAMALETVAEELFRAERAISAHPDLARALTDRTMPLESRMNLVERILAHQCRRETLALVRQAVRAPHGRSIAPRLLDYSEQAAQRQSRSIARVEAATPLTTHQIDRLRASLTRLYGHEIHVNVDVVPEAVGGIRIRIGDDVIDATVLSRLQEARRRLAD